MGKESGYRSEPGYRGDVEFGYGESGYEILGHEGEGEGEGEGGGKSKQSRSEKKSRKAMLKLGMKPITGDIELVMTQARVPRPRAVKALKAADGDIVSAIMEYSIEVLKT
ncbi:hypothetical protein Bca101_082534 [Brassica carinata]